MKLLFFLYGSCISQAQEENDGFILLTYISHKYLFFYVANVFIYFFQVHTLMTVDELKSTFNVEDHSLGK